MNVFTMFKAIPNFPNYQFNPETLEVKSLKRKAYCGLGRYNTVKEKILKLCKNHKGYYQYILYNDKGGKRFSRSQISWLVRYGSLPQKPLQIDHIDANKTNDYWWNLQALTNRENCSKRYWQNGTKYPTGVYLHKTSQKYMARIQINGQEIYLGLHKTVVAASNAYQKEVALL